MKLVLAALLLSLLAGCSGVTRMTNDMIIMEAIKCEQADLPWRQQMNYDGSVSGVYCMPPPTGRIVRQS